MTHYDALGVGRDATSTEVRDAFRRAARAAHPDRNGEGSADRMARVNEAWRVLGDAERRRRYDAELDEADRPAPATSPVPRPRPPVPVVEPERARIPWRFMAALASVGILLVVVGVITYDAPPPRAPDGILRTGDCVDLTPTFEAVEVQCGGHDAVVDQLVPFDQPCPADTEGYRDRQGMGVACVVRSGG